MFDVAFMEFDIRVFGASKDYQLRTDIEPNRIVSLFVQQIGEDARSAAQIGDARTATHLSQPHTGRYQPYIAFGGEDVIGVRGGMTVEERYLLLLILCRQSYHFDFLARWQDFDNEGCRLENTLGDGDCDAPGKVNDGAVGSAEAAPTSGKLGDEVRRQLLGVSL
jgi:hypothetical protein